MYRNANSFIHRSQSFIGSIRANDLSDTIIICGPVAGPIYVERCHQCTFVVSGHQLRIHSSTDTTFVIDSGSRSSNVNVNANASESLTLTPIIEDCKDLHFTNQGYMDITTKAGIGFNNSNHDRTQKEDDGDSASHSSLPLHVKDFNWHNVKQHSPNWSILSDSAFDEMVLNWSQRLKNGGEQQCI
jgi:hypothetical protein